jgi:ComF family protein
MRVGNIISDFINLFYPKYCYGCGGGMVAGEDILCTHCLLDLPKTDYHLHENNPIQQRLRNRLPVTFAAAFLKFRKSGLVQHLLHELKYNNRPEIGVRLGKIYGRELSLTQSFDVIIPVPLHASRQRQRRYNQSEKFAEGLSQALSIPYEDNICIRKTKTSTQTRKNRLERWENVQDVFQLTHAQRLNGKHVLLVDDVFTTGATVEACGQILLESGCQLSVACIAHAQ